MKIAVWACALAVASVVANAQDYPSQPIRLVVGYPAGGSIDVGARLIGQKLSDILGQPFVIENRTGASGAVAAEFVARSVPDGYTILLQPGDFFTTASLLPNLTFDPNKDLLPIAMVTDNPLVIAAAAHAPFNTVKEFIAAAKISPTGFTYATVGVATSNNVVGQWIGLETHAKMVHVPYRSGPDAALATISGDVNVVITSPASIYPGLVDAGKVKVIALTGTDHPSYLPASGRRWPRTGCRSTPPFMAVCSDPSACPSQSSPGCSERPKRRCKMTRCARDSFLMASIRNSWPELTLPRVSAPTPAALRASCAPWACRPSGDVKLISPPDFGRADDGRRQVRIADAVQAAIGQKLIQLGAERVIGRAVREVAAGPTGQVAYQFRNDGIRGLILQLMIHAKKQDDVVTELVRVAEARFECSGPLGEIENLETGWDGEFGEYRARGVDRRDIDITAMNQRGAVARKLKRDEAVFHADIEDRRAFGVVQQVAQPAQTILMVTNQALRRVGRILGSPLQRTAAIKFHFPAPRYARLAKGAANIRSQLFRRNGWWSGKLLHSAYRQHGSERHRFGQSGPPSTPLEDCVPV